MSDPIERQAALDALADYIHNVDRVFSTGNMSADDCMDAAVSVLGEDELPSAQPGWIPCKTALPEYDGEYLVTKKSFGWNCKEYIETDIARYEKKDGWHKADTVLAWCELPTPYLEGGQDNGTD